MCFFLTGRISFYANVPFCLAILYIYQMEKQFAMDTVDWSFSDAKKRIQQFATQTIASRVTSTLQSAFSVV